MFVQLTKRSRCASVSYW